MSLVIGVVDRTNRMQSVYSDGKTVRGSEIAANESCKIGQFQSGKYTVSFGSCGSCNVNQYFRYEFQSVFEEYIKNTPQKYDETQETYFTKHLPKMFNHLLSKYIEEFNVTEADDEVTKDSNHLVIINGDIFEVNKYKYEKFRCFCKRGSSFDAIGCADYPAILLLEAEVPIDRIFQVVSKHNTAVNDTVFRIENTIYQV